MHPSLWPLTTSTREDGLFASLRQEIQKTKVKEARKNAWILVDTWRLVNTRVSSRQDSVRYQGLILNLNLHIAAI